jgi:hypothetical protein
MQPEEDNPHNLKLYGWNDLAVRHLAQTLRERFGAPNITFENIEYGFMVVVPPTVTEPLFHQIKMFSEGFLAGLDWHRP